MGTDEWMAAVVVGLVAGWLLVRGFGAVPG